MLTHLLYLEDFNLLACEAEVLEIVKEENEKTVIVLNQTVFYPQGGGQPYDQGVIEGVDGRFLVEEVRFVEGVVKHIGVFEQDPLRQGASEARVFGQGEKMRCVVEPERRKLHSRLHSAGHVLDMAVDALKLPWVPGKGYHFPDGPYVEYSGEIQDSEKEKLREEIEEKSNEFIRLGIATKPVFMAKEEMHAVCRFVPDNLPTGKPMRVVMYGEFGVPCGGTHVNNLKEIGPMSIRKVKVERGKIKVSYELASSG